MPKKAAKRSAPRRLPRLHLEGLEARVQPAPLFDPAITIATGRTPADVVVADFNRDGHDDVAILNAFDFNASVLLGDGNGHLNAAPGSPVSTGDPPTTLRAVDVNRDNIPDLVVATSRFVDVDLPINRIVVRFGVGNGTFTNGPSYTTSLGPASAIASGDFDQDGDQDLAVVRPAASAIEVLQNDGNGQFTFFDSLIAASVLAGAGSDAIVATDLNRDGDPDLVVAAPGDNSVKVFLGAAGMRFLFGSSTLAGSRPSALTVGDFNEDGRNDIAVVSPGDDSIVILTGDGNGNLTRVAAALNTLGTPAAVVAADFNKDGHVDLAAVTNVVEPVGFSGVQAFLGVGNATFANDRGGPYRTDAFPQHLAVGLFNRDNKPDLTVTNLEGDNASLLLSPDPGPAYVLGAGFGGGPHLKAYNADGTLRFSFYAYSAGFKGGVRTALADVTGDGTPDIITGAGPGGGPHVKVFDGRTGQVVRSFFAFSADFHGGVHIAAGDVNGDGFADIITGVGSTGQPLVTVWSGRTGAMLANFFAYDPLFPGGVRLAAGDVNGDGLADIITGAGPSGGPHVKVFDGRTFQEIRSFMAYAPNFIGGIFVAAGDVNGDGRSEIITTPDVGGGPHLRIFDGGTLRIITEYFVYAANFQGGVRVASADIDGDGKDDVIASPGPTGGTVCWIFRGTDGTELRHFGAFDPAFAGSAYVGGANRPPSAISF